MCLRRLLLGESIRIKAEVEVWNGRTRFRVKHNHFVQQALIHLINMMTVGGGAITPPRQWNVYSGRYTLRLGTNTTTPTDASMTTLVNEIATEPNSLSGANENPSLGVVRIKVTATWLAGTVSGTIGELGLRWGLFTGLQGFGWNPNSDSGTKNLLSRLSCADGDFTQFTINTGVPLTIEWRITFTFA